MARRTTHASFQTLKQTLTIIGGGLTGLSLAIALRKHHIPVILHEAGQYPRHRVCGEFISGVSKQTLDTLGITQALSDATAHTRITWFSENEKIRETRLRHPALAISRFRLDQRLLEIARQAGAEIHIQSRQQIQPGTPGHIRTAGRIPARGTWIGLKAHVKGIVTTADLEMHRGPIGYLGITPVEDGWFNACGLFRIDRTIDAKHHTLLPAYLRKNGNQTLAETLETAEWRQDSFSAVAGFDLGPQKPTPGILSLGDSHSIIPPFTGNGMTMAFQSAEIALPKLISFASDKTDWETTCQQINSQLDQHFRKRLTASRLIHPILFSKSARHLLKHAPIAPILSLIR
jgi:flavin-dependent dehydrogenase